MKRIRCGIFCGQISNGCILRSSALLIRNKRKNNFMPKLLLFPPFQARPLRRLLAYLQEQTIITENEQIYTFASVGELASLLYQEQLLLFVSALAAVPHDLFEYLIDRGEVWCTKHGDPISVQLHYPNRATRWIVSAKTWGCPRPTVAFLQRLRNFLAIMEVGDSGSPGGVGLAKLRASWLGQYGLNWKRHRQERPNQAAVAEIRARGMGARSDLLSTDTYEFAWELDRKNAYASDLAQPLPTGPAMRFGHGLIAPFPVWVGTCQVTIPDALCYGLFPMRNLEKQLYYPTQPGQYETWLWSNQAALCARHGLHVEPLAGWGWYETTTDCASFVEQLTALRDQHPEHAGLIKLALVAAIGRLGMEDVRYMLSRHASEEDVRIALERRASDYFVKTEVEYRPQTMPHWFWYVLASGFCSLTEEAYNWAKGEYLLGTNTDAVILKPEADISRYPSKHSPENWEMPLGRDSNLVGSTDGWRSRKLTKVTLPALRHLIATDAQTGQILDKRPGKKKREEKS
jgi:hypothetical protein